MKKVFSTAQIIMNILKNLLKKIYNTMLTFIEKTPAKPTVYS